jgi:hypothetical protein
MYERRTDPLLPIEHFWSRVRRHGMIGAVIIFGSLGAGTLGYHALQPMGWDDALLNASMILTGMGPVAELTSTPAKLFAAAYALYSGLVFVTVTAILLAPFAHRLLHHLHSPSQ